VAAFLAHLKIGAASAPAALAELQAWLGAAAAPLERDPDFAIQLAVALEPIGLETLDEARRGLWASGAPQRLGELVSDEVVRFAAQSWLARRVGAACRRAPDAPETRERLGALFRARVHMPPDANGDADEILAFVTGLCPPGSLADVMGLQNIKGPGLAIVRRLADLEVGRAETPPPIAPSAWRRALGWLRASVDHVPSVGRRRRADRLYDDLACGRLSAARAARELAGLVEQQRRS
jgi:hypothetical protein